MRAVEGAQAEIVEAVVIVAGQARRARSSSSQIHSRKRSFNLLLFLPRGNGFLLVDDAGVLVDLVIGGRRASVERMLDQVGRKRPRRAIGRRVADVGFRGAVERRPSRWRWRRHG